MKKMILVMCVFCLCATTVKASCNGGAVSGDLCISNVLVNWWIASAWCQANGRHLATMYEACPNWDGRSGSIRCPVLGGNNIGDRNNRAWTATASSSDKAFI